MEQLNNKTSQNVLVPNKTDSLCIPSVNEKYSDRNDNDYCNEIDISNIVDGIMDGIMDNNKNNDTNNDTNEMEFEQYFNSDTKQFAQFTPIEHRTIFRSGISLENLNKLTYMKTTSKSSSKLSLILDLDETLVHTIVTSNINELKNLITMDHLLFCFPHSTHQGTFYYIVFSRPHVFDFLNDLSSMYDIYVYTNGVHWYAERIIGQLKAALGFNPFINYFTRQEKSENLIKSLENIQNVCHAKCIIIDDLVEVWSTNKDKVIQIKQYIGPADPYYYTDFELSKIKKMLIEIKNDADNLFASTGSYDLMSSIIETYRVDYNDSNTINAPKLTPSQFSIGKSPTNFNNLSNLLNVRR